MDRGDSVASSTCQSLLGNVVMIDIRKKTQGCNCKECFSCEASTELKFFHQNGHQNGQEPFAYAKEESDCFCRECCTPIRPFTMVVQDTNGSELFTVERPCACCWGPCKCCCYQTLTVTSGGNLMGTITETFYCCAPKLNVTDKSGNNLYKIHPPTCSCCCGMCTQDFDICWVFDANQTNTNGDDAEHLGSVVKKMKSLATQVFTDAHHFDVTFPEIATVEQKAILAGSVIFINELFYRGGGDTGLISA